MSGPIKLHVLQDGPLQVQGASSVHYCGEPLEAEGDIYLCRCGQTANAPFCDGSHKRVGFEGTSEARAPKEVRVWEGKTLRTYFNPNTCMHVFHCKPLKAARERELAGDAAAAEEIMKVVATCPSGALTYETKVDMPTPPEPDLGPEIDIQEGGEVRVQVPFEIDAPQPERQREARATLCRCGLSTNKPWCDGRHKKRDDGFR